MDHVEKAKRRRHPEETANIVSVLTFFYSKDLFKKGFKKDLEEEDLYEVVTKLKSETIGDQLEIEWEKQRKTGKQSLYRLLWACYGTHYLTIGFIQLVMNTVMIMVQPMAQSKLVKYFETNQTELTTFDAWMYAVLLIVVNLIYCIYSHNYYLIVTGIGIKIRTAFCSFIYRKVLKLSPTKLGDISIGKVVTLMTKDVQSFESFVHFANNIWIGMAKTLIICVMIYCKIGVAAIAGIGFFFIVMPIQIYLGKWAAKLRFSMCKKTDERLQVTQETLSAIRIIKMYTWERFFCDKISDTRKKEIASMYTNFYLKFIVLVIGSLNAKIAFYILLMTYIYLGNRIDGEIVYFIQNCFNILHYSLAILFPIGIAQSAELFTSGKRIGRVLKSLELQIKSQDKTVSVINPKIILKNVSVDFKHKEILMDINLYMDMGLNLIAGPVGSGKSMLLKTILQDLEVSKGNLEVLGEISYASQEPWLFPSSVRQNILFGEQYNEERYQKVVEVCALRYDFDLLEAGDSTIVEDRGMNLSKGQQARVNLARAIYKEADIYLLDDCLAALDAHVSDFIFTECIQKYLQNKLVVLVTHNTNHLKDVDNVIVMAHGRIKSVAKASEITENDIRNLELLEDEEEILQELPDDIDDEDEDNLDEKTKLVVTEATTERKVYHEKKQEGEVNVAIYNKYIKFGGGYFAMILVVGVFVLAQLSSSLSDKLVAKWVNLEQNITNLTEGTEEYLKVTGERDWNLNLYTVVIGTTAFLMLSRAFAIFTFARKASIRLHKYMIVNVVNAAMEFFDTNFIGNILNRFSKDLNTIDESIPYVFFHLFATCLQQFGIIILIASVYAEFLIPTAVFFVLLVIVRRIYMPAGRSLKRLDAITRSPVVGHLNATLEGLTTIRAFKAEDIVRKEFDRHQDLYTSATYTMQCSMRAFAYFLDTLCIFFITSILLKFLLSDEPTQSGDVGLAISQAFMMTGSLQWGIRQWAEIENQMTSVERVMEYTDVRQETTQGSVLDHWPTVGEVKYENVSLTYTNSNERVLKNINFLAKPKEKIGIVGRTGAGKSSIISTLFRLYEVEGQIIIDGVDTRTLSLEFLRSKISIIPQDPVLFSGTIRDNIDPARNYTDEEIWHAVEVANLKPLVPSLDFEITENGSNFSVGQRQLLCLARAVIRNNKIIVLDEATANMDHETDTLIHETIEKNLGDCTVFTIAHKLQTILHSDKVMVLDKGEVIEYDDPNVLLENRRGNFYKMVQKAGLLPQE